MLITLPFSIGRFQPFSSYHLVRFQIMGSLIFWLGWSLSGRHLLALVLVFCHSQVLFLYIFWKFQIIVQSLNSPKFENRSLSDDLCKSMLKWRCMLKSNCDSEFCSCDHVNRHSKFCLSINWMNNSTLDILHCNLSCSPR